MILIDLKNAFDTIDHDILLQKRKAIRFSESTIKWIESYLSKRILLVNIEKKLSEFENIYCGAAQESILGPLLFVIYINYMLQAVTSTPLLYEDDLCILHQYKNVGQIQNDSMKALKIFVTGLFITNSVWIRQNLFFLQVNGEQRVSVNY